MFKIESKIWAQAKKCISVALLTTGIVFLVLLMLSFTSLPFWMYYALGSVKTDYSGEPDYIVVMGGGGMPSASGLMRTYKAAEEAALYPEAPVIIALPGDVEDTSSSIWLMKDELVLRGVHPAKVLFEPKGTNTRMQALDIEEMIGADAPILLITSPEHMWRSVKAFQKLGFQSVYSRPSFEKALEADLFFKDDELGGNRFPAVGDKLGLRYQFWNHLQYQIIVYREYVAIVYYKMKGWI